MTRAAWEAEPLAPRSTSREVALLLGGLVVALVHVALAALVHRDGWPVGLARGAWLGFGLALGAARLLAWRGAVHLGPRATRLPLPSFHTVRAAPATRSFVTSAGLGPIPVIVLVVLGFGVAGTFVVSLTGALGEGVGASGQNLLLASAATYLGYGGLLAFRVLRAGAPTRAVIGRLLARRPVGGEVRGAAPSFTIRARDVPSPSRGTLAKREVDIASEAPDELVVETADGELRVPCEGALVGLANWRIATSGAGEHVYTARPSTPCRALVATGAEPIVVLGPEASPGALRARLFVLALPALGVLVGASVGAALAL